MKRLQPYGIMSGTKTRQVMSAPSVKLHAEIQAMFGTIAADSNLAMMVAAG